MSENNFQHKTEELQYLWDVYKYRHDLVWRTIFKITFAVLFLSTIPYIEKWDSIHLDSLTLLFSGLGVFLAIFGLLYSHLM